MGIGDTAGKHMTEHSLPLPVRGRQNLSEGARCSRQESTMKAKKERLNLTWISQTLLSCFSSPKVPLFFIGWSPNSQQIFLASTGYLLIYLSSEETHMLFLSYAIFRLIGRIMYCSTIHAYKSVRFNVAFPYKESCLDILFFPHLTPFYSLPRKV